ncbi:H-NS histone family protein (plasmid) [Paraburkholderia sp. PREW-6R]|uniref:H-NS histone family protein n=1 Tax=Paraburkholderia sp. PREW-6R TaxID=3141544 RepID=UPI0031F5BBFE
MASYRELLEQRDALQQRIDAARESELDEVVRNVRAIIKEYSLTPAQVFGQATGKRGPKPGIRPAKYRDPMSGATWSGVGRQPAWIKGQPYERFLIRD